MDTWKSDEAILITRTVYAPGKSSLCNEKYSSLEEFQLHIFLNVFETYV